MKKFLIAIFFVIFVLIGSKGLPLFAVDFGDLLYTLNNPNAYGTPEYDTFGYTVDIDGDYAIAGAYLEDDSGGINSGKAYVFNVSDGSLLYTLDNPNAYGTSAGDTFGYTVDIDGDYAIAGAYLEDDSGGINSGKVYVFNVSDGSLLYTLNNPNDYGTIVSDSFGNTLSTDGNYLIVGTPLEDDSGGTSSGKAYIFDLSDGSLLYTLDNPNDYGTSEGDMFGNSVSIYGNYAIVGASGEDYGGTSSGTTYVFDTTDGSLLYTLDNPNVYGTPAFDGFGSSVSNNSSYVIVGAYGEDVGGVSSTGIAYVFNLSDGSLLYTLNNPNAYGTGVADTFGYGVSIGGDYAIVGAYQEDDSGGTSSGKAYIFDMTTGNLLNTLDNPNTYSTSASDFFGRVVATDGYNFIVSAHGEKYPYPPPSFWLYENSGIAYIFKGIDPIIQYTISFESNGGSAVADITQDEGTVVTPPDDPTRDGYTFDGWYEDIDLTIAYTFSTMTETITLYAKWTIVSTDGLTNNFAFIFIAILLYFALLFLRYKTGARVWNIFGIGIIIFLITQYSTFIPMIIVLTGVIIYQLYDTFLGGK